MTNKTKQVMISDYFPGMGLPGRDGEDGNDGNAMGALNTPARNPNCCKIYQSATLSGSPGSPQTIVFDTADFGESSWVGSLPTLGITPKVAGYYLVTATLYVSLTRTTSGAGASPRIIGIIMKNGTTNSFTGTYVVRADTYLDTIILACSGVVCMSSIIYMNGSTDYFTLLAYSDLDTGAGTITSVTYGESKEGDLHLSCVRVG